MFLHLGNDYIINTKNLVGIFDLENTSVSKYTKEFINNASKQGRVFNCTYEMPKSYVVTLDENLTETVYISQLACSTLLKRFNKQ